MKGNDALSGVSIESVKPLEEIPLSMSTAGVLTILQDDDI